MIAPKNEKRLPAFVPHTDIEKLFEKVISKPKDWKEKTTRLMVLIFYSTGMRLSEVINEDSDVNEAGSSLKILGKEIRK